MKNIKIKKILIISILVFSMQWILGVLRFSYSIAEYLYQIIFFPFGLINHQFESYCWNNLPMNHFFNDEIVQFSIWIFCGVLQIILIYKVIEIIKMKIIEKELNA